MPHQGQLAMFSMTCIRRWSSTPSNSVASRIRNLQGYLWIILQLCDQEVRKRLNLLFMAMMTCLHLTKNMKHQRRAAGKARTTVAFTEDMIVTLKKDNFPANSKNKQWFINMLSRFLQEDSAAQPIMLKVMPMYSSSRQPKILLETGTLYGCWR